MALIFMQGLQVAPQDSVSSSQEVEKTTSFLEYVDSIVPWETAAIILLKISAILILAWVLIRVVDRAVRIWNNRFAELPTYDHGPRRAAS